MTQQIPGGGVDLSHIIRKDQPQTSPAGAPPASTAQGGQGQQTTVDVPSTVMTVTDQSFEQVMQLSSIVPVVVVFGAPNCEPCEKLEPILETVTRGLDGRVLLAKVDAEQNPALQQAFQVQQLPTVAALLRGQAIPMFHGLQTEQQIREVYTQLLTVSAQQGVQGKVNAQDAQPQESEEPQINPEHEAALAAIEEGDYKTAVAEYERVLTRSPKDAQAQAALAQVRLLYRLQGASAEEIRQAAGDDPNSINAQLSVADLDVSGGHIEDAFLRLLDLFERVATDEREPIRERLLEYFEVVGPQDPRVIAARTRLTNLLFS